jgi:hypothetical protein
VSEGKSKVSGTFSRAIRGKIKGVRNLFKSYSIQAQTKYDGDGNVIEAVTSDRFNNDSTSTYGALAPITDMGACVY